jgi:hypothetical protein
MEAVMPSGDWFLIPAGDFDVMGSSFGAVTDVPSLYSQATFGPKDDNRCGCGKYVGQQYDGIICDQCGVKVFADSSVARHKRLGHIRLACWCAHPVTSKTVELFPVAPVAFRTTPDGLPTALGRKYGTLAELNHAATQALPPRDTADAYYPAARNFNRAELLAAMRDILIGTGPNLTDPHSVLDLAVNAMAAGSSYLSALVRCYGYVLRAEVTV